MEPPDKFVYYSNGYSDRVKFNEDTPEHVFLAHARTQALLAIAASIEHLANELKAYREGRG